MGVPGGNVPAWKTGPAVPDASNHWPATAPSPNRDPPLVSTSVLPARSTANTATPSSSGTCQRKSPLASNASRPGGFATSTRTPPVGSFCNEGMPARKWSEVWRGRVSAPWESRTARSQELPSGLKASIPSNPEAWPMSWKWAPELVPRTAPDASTNETHDPPGWPAFVDPSARVPLPSPSPGTQKTLPGLSTEALKRRGSPGCCGASPAHSSTGGGGTLAKAATTERSPSSVTLQSPLPEQSPLHPANCDPVSAAAVRMTRVPAGIAATHVVPQSIPGGLEVMRPAPSPARATESWCWDGGGDALANAATDTAESAVSVMLQPPAPLHVPPQPPKRHPPSAVATSETGTPESKAAEQLVPQSIPAGVDLTVPEPVFETVSTGCRAGTRL